MPAKVVNRFLERSAIKFICAGSTSSKKLMALVDESYFNNSINKLVFKRIKTLYQKEQEIVSWRALQHDTALPDKARAALIEFKEKPIINSKKAAELQNQLFNYRRRYMLDQVARLINEKQVSDSYNDEDVINQVAEMMVNARSKVESEKPLSFGENSNYKPVLKRVLLGEALRTLKTGFDPWDNVNGGIVGKTVTLITGYTGSMKSTLAEILGCNFADVGARVGEVSLEMSQEEKLILRAARLARIDRTRIMQAKDLTNKEQSRIARKLAEKDEQWAKTGACVTTFTPKRGWTADELFLNMEAFGYHVLVIDYVSLIKGMMEGKDFWMKLMAFTARAKQFANDTDCRVIILGQATKENAIKLSTNMLNDADLWWHIEHDDEKDENDYMVIRCGKARKQKPQDFALKKEGMFASLSNPDNQDALKKSLEKMEVKNKPSKYSKASGEDSGSINVRGKQDDKEIEDYFRDASLGEADD